MYHHHAEGQIAKQPGINTVHREAKDGKQLPIKNNLIPPERLKILFFTLLAVSTVAALQTVGAFLVICLVVTPGATAWLLTDRFPRLLMIAVAMGSITSFLGAWASYYLDGATGGIIVVAQTLLFLLAFVFAPKHGLLASRRRARQAQEIHP